MFFNSKLKTGLSNIRKAPLTIYAINTVGIGYFIRIFHFKIKKLFSRRERYFEVELVKNFNIKKLFLGKKVKRCYYLTREIYVSLGNENAKIKQYL